MASSGTAQCLVEDDLEERYNRLKRKYSALLETTLQLSDDLESSKATISKLEKQKTYLLDKVIRYSDQIPLRRPGGGAPATSSGARGRVALGDGIFIDEADGYALTGRPFDNFIFASAMNPARGAMGGIAMEDRTTTASGKELQPLCAGTSGGNRPCRSRAQPGSAYCWRHSPLDANSGMVYCKFKDDKKGKSCTNPITKQQAEEDPYCTVHSKMARGLPVGPGAGSWSGPGTPAHDGGDDFDDM